MPTNTNESARLPEVDETKRNLLIGGAAAVFASTVGATAGLAQQVLENEIIPASLEEKGAQIDYIPSTLGVDYRSMAPSPIAELLSQGEGEWLVNAREDFQEDTEGAWIEETVPDIINGHYSNVLDEDLRNFTPNMLLLMGVAIDPEDPKYGGFWSLANSTLAQRLAGAKT